MSVDYFGTYGVYLLVAFLLGVIFQKYLLSFASLFSNHIPPNLRLVKRVAKRSAGDNKRRGLDYPKVAPNGWYKLCNSRDLPKGGIKYVSAMGLDYVAFRGESGEIAVMDAYCPHLGANLSVGGTVVGDCIQCPFHKWEFDLNGKCTKIPYTDKVPAQASTTVYHAMEYYGMVIVWYDAAGRAPTYKPPTFPYFEKDGFSHRGSYSQDISMHLLEIAENSADFQHFPVLHNKMGIPFTNFKLPLIDIDIHHSTDWIIDPAEPHLIVFYDRAEIAIFGKKLPESKATAKITFIGPSSLMSFEFDTPVGRIVLFQSHLPMEQLATRVELEWFAERKIWKLLVWYVVGNWINQWKNDIAIWENKIHTRSPLLTKGDGPIFKLRKWFSQFYDNGDDLTGENINNMYAERKTKPKVQQRSQQKALDW